MMMVLVVDTDDPVCGSPCVSVKQCVLVAEHVEANESDEHDLLLQVCGNKDDAVDKDDERLAEIRFPTSK